MRLRFLALPLVFLVLPAPLQAQDMIADVVGPFVSLRPRLSFDLALEAARTAFDLCRKNHNPAVVEVFSRGFTQRVALGDGVDDLYKQARIKAAQIFQPAGDAGGPNPAMLERPTEIATLRGGAALPLFKGKDFYGAIAVSGTLSVADDIRCAKAGVNRIQNQLSDQP